MIQMEEINKGERDLEILSVWDGSWGLLKPNPCEPNILQISDLFREPFNDGVFAVALQYSPA